MKNSEPRGSFQNIVEKAILFAGKAHAGQKRKSTGAPYFSHVEQVAELVGALTDDSEMTAAAYLHDTLEDTDTTYYELKNNFGRHVANDVYALTNDENMIRKQGKVAYMVSKWKAMNPDVLLIKMCDTLANMLDSPSCSQAKNYMKILKEAKKEISQNPVNIWTQQHDSLAERIVRAYADLPYSR